VFVTAILCPMVLQLDKLFRQSVALSSGEVSRAAALTPPPAPSPLPPACGGGDPHLSPGPSPLPHSGRGEGNKGGDFAAGGFAARHKTPLFNPPLSLGRKARGRGGTKGGEGVKTPLRLLSEQFVKVQYVRAMGWPKHTQWV